MKRRKLQVLQDPVNLGYRMRRWLDMIFRRFTPVEVDGASSC